MGDLKSEQAGGFAWHNPVNIDFAWGSLQRLPQILDGKPALLVLFPEARGIGLRGELEKMLPHLVGVIDDVQPNPALRHVEALHRRFWTEWKHAEIVVAIGGGSVLDTAKCLCVTTGVGFAGALDAAQPITESRPLIAVPTTAGTGSEVTPWATVWDPDAAPPRKLSLHRQQAWPHTALVDPSLTRSLQRGATIAGALDALSHSLEAIWNRNANPVSDRLAVGAARKVIEILPKVLASPADRESRSALSLAATMAGLAFSNTKTALAHEISYALTLQRGITHGIACSAPLPLVWRLAQGKDGARDAVLAEIFDCPASDGAARLENFLHGVDVATDLRRYDFSSAEIDAILDKAQSGARGRNFIGAQAMRVA